MNRTGEWVELDGGAIRMRVYKKGTAHLEVAPSLAWQLNEILAMLYPRAIPPEFRTEKAKKTQEFHLSQSLLGFDVTYELGQISQVYTRCERSHKKLKPIENVYELRYAHSMDKHLRQKCCDVLRSLGGVELEHYEFKFDYNPEQIIESVCFSGRIPDKFSHQFYPTTDVIGDRMVAKLGKLNGSDILEPQAGQGALASKLKGNLTLVEISELHCDILKKKGFTKVHQADFLKWSDDAYTAGIAFDAIVMNPPFSQGRSTMHLEAAIKLLKRNGTLVALVTYATARKIKAIGFHKEIEMVDASDFKGVSIELAIVTLKGE